MSGHIVAIGGGAFLTTIPDPRLDAFILGLTGKERPSVCYLGTASGDSQSGLYRFYGAMREHECRPTELTSSCARPTSAAPCCVACRPG